MINNEKYPIYDNEGCWGLHQEFHDFLKLWSYNATKYESDTNAKVPYHAGSIYRDAIKMLADGPYQYPPVLREEVQYRPYPVKAKNGETLYRKVTITHKEMPKQYGHLTYWDLNEWDRIQLNADDLRPLKYAFCRGDIHENLRKYKYYEEF